MKWIIKCPAPTDSRQRKWGDYHFARSLAKQLVRLRHQVLIQYHSEWSNGNDDADAVLLLRGKYPYAPRNRDALHVMWLLSHPTDVSRDELARYDLCAVASRSHAARLAGSGLRNRIVPLLQCTDGEEFNLSRAEPLARRRDIVFVGNTRDSERWGVLAYLHAGFPLKIWGRGWERWPQAQACVVADYIENEHLGVLYGSARASLNDHWPDMRECGFINNRIFDSVACGLPIVSDRHAELEAVFGDSVLYYDPGQPMLPTLERLVLEYPHLYDRTQRQAEEVLARHSFAHRVDELLSYIADLAQQRPGAPPAWLETLRKPPLEEEAGTATAAGAVESEASAPAISEQPIRIDIAIPEGDGNWCPVCETLIDDFIPGGVVKKRQRAKCPNCGVLERHRLMALYLRAHTPLFDSIAKRVLHVAPEGPIADLVESAPGVSYLSADLSGEHVMVTMDLTDIQYPDASFDLILCSHVLEHIPDDAKAMREMHRVLSPGGLAVIQVPVYGATTYEDFSITSPKARLAAFGQEDHVRKYGTDIAQRLAASGFGVTIMRLPTDAQVCHRLGLKPSPVFDCRKV